MKNAKPSAAMDNTLDDKAARIIEVAKTLFVSNGYAATSMDDVAARAQMSKTTLYTRYPSKALLFAAVITVHADSTGMNLDPAELPQMPVEQALFVIAKRFVEFSCHPDAIRLELVYQSEARQLPEVATAFEHGGPQHSIAEVERYFKVMTKQKQLALDDARFAAAHFLNSIKGTPSGISLSPYAGLSEARKDAHIRKIIKLFLNGALARRN